MESCVASVEFQLSVEDSPLRSEEHTSELQSRLHLVCRLLLEKKKPHPRPARHRAPAPLAAPPPRPHRGPTPARRPCSRPPPQTPRPPPDPPDRTARTARSRSA